MRYPRSKRRWNKFPPFEPLEKRVLFTYSLDIGANGALTFTQTGGQTGNDLTLSTTGTSGAYTFALSADSITLSANAINAGWTTSNHSATGPDSSVRSIQLHTGDTTETIQSTDAPVTVNALLVIVQTVSLGGASDGAQSIGGPVDISNDNGDANVIINDINNVTSEQYAISSSSITGLTPSPITLESSVNNVEVEDGTGNDVATIASTPAADPNNYSSSGVTITTIAQDSVNVQTVASQ